MFQKIMEDCIEWKYQVGYKLPNGLRKYADNTVYRIIRTQYNIYIRNGSANGAFEEFKRFDALLKQEHFEEWQEIGKRNKYIKILQTRNKLAFLAESLFMQLYNNVKGVN